MLKWQIFSLKNFPKLYSEIENKRMYGIIYSSSFTSNQVESPVARRFATWKAKTRAPLRSDATFQTIRICKRTHMVWLYMELMKQQMLFSQQRARFKDFNL